MEEGASRTGGGTDGHGWSSAPLGSISVLGE